MSDQSFVRTEMLGDKPPPASQVGPVKWMMENLFSSIPNAIMSILSVLVVYYVLSGVLPWMFQSSWDATSLKGCRAAIIEAYGEGTDGACWAVIRERWRQLLFGFYPRELYWRPLAALVLLFVAMSPILFARVPRKVILFSMVYPFLGFWLLWGGSIWLPIVAMSGFVVAYASITMLEKLIGSLGATIAAAVLPILFWLVLAGPIISGLNSVAPIGIESIDSDQMGGFMISIIIGISGIALSLPIGILLALGRQSPLFVVKTICVTFIEFIRGVPLITLLFVASVLLNYFLPPGTNFDLILRVIIMVTFFAAAYMAEVIRGGLAALPTGQYEAADALGLDYWKATRLIIMPQALKVSIPNIVSNFIGLFKDTTLVSIIGLLDPMGLSRAIVADQNWNGIVWEIYAFIAVLFWVFTFAMSRYSMYLERKLATGH